MPIRIGHFNIRVPHSEASSCTCTAGAWQSKTQAWLTRRFAFEGTRKNINNGRGLHESAVAAQVKSQR